MNLHPREEPYTFWPAEAQLFRVVLLTKVLIALHSDAHRVTHTCRFRMVRCKTFEGDLTWHPAEQGLLGAGRYDGMP